MEEDHVGVIGLGGLTGTHLLGGEVLHEGFQGPFKAGLRRAGTSAARVGRLATNVEAVARRSPTTSP
eukprot:10911830-Lingulodinium_polyedra.AAC.1